MKQEIKVPSMGESVTEAIVSSILKPSGSQVQAEDEVLELETEKVNQVLYAPAAGKITITAKIDDKVAIGDVVGYVDTEEVGEALPPSEAPKEEAPAGSGTRKMAKDFLEEKPAKTPAVAPPLPVSEEGDRRRMSGLRKTIAERLVMAKNETAMLTTFNEVDMTKVIETRTHEKEHFIEKYGVKLGFMSFFVKAVVAALKEFPEVNSMIDGEEIVTFKTYDIGVAVSTDRGLFVPVIKGCNELSFAEIEKRLGEYASKARDGTISMDHLRGGSFTITNGGVFGSLLSTPILNPPQSAILGMHTIQKRPVVVDDEIVIRPMMYLALSYDHRLIDGKEAVQFLVKVKEILENPEQLALYV